MLQNKTMEQNTELNQVLQNFQLITLTDMDNRAKLMKRQETKYLVTKKGLINILKELGDQYFMLEEEGDRVSPYNNTYMDTRQLIFYYDHENEKEVRIKVRKRKYVNSKKTFIEYKVKSDDNMDKKRMELGKNSINHMDKTSKDFIKKQNGDVLLVLPTMNTDYQRITLCNKVLKERVTIDLDLFFSEPKQPGLAYKVNDFVIFEVKQEIGEVNTFCKDIIEKHGGVLARGCSKYCLGLIYFQRVKKFNHFKKTLAFIEEHGGVTKVNNYIRKARTKKKIKKK